MRIISIDPGYDRCGLAVIEKDRARGKEVLLFSSCAQTNAKDPFHDRVSFVCRKIESVIEEYAPGALAIERLFFNTNQKTASRISEVRGAIIQSAYKLGLSVYEYTPLEIKVATTGYGRSSKSQVISMIPHLVKINKDIKRDDEWDAIAVGLTCFAREKFK